MPGCHARGCAQSDCSQTGSLWFWACNRTYRYEVLGAYMLKILIKSARLGKYCFGKTPMQTFIDSKRLAIDKQLDRTIATFNHFLVDH